MLHLANRMRGSLTLPGDKSISHRALLFAAIGTGRSVITGLGTGDDILRTAQCLRQLGVRIDLDVGVARVESPGFAMWHTPAAPLDCGNSGTTMRLLLGLVAAHPVLTVQLDGDSSLRNRPMARVVQPLIAMDAQIQSQGGRPPLVVTGRTLHGAAHVLPVASAQVKSALLLAGLFAEGETAVVEPLQSRDHTERMLAGLGVALENVGTRHAITGRGPRAVLPALGDFVVPGDPSSAAFAIVAAALHRDADVTVRQFSHNPTRAGFLRVLERMGARLETHGWADVAGEPVADVRARSSRLQAADIVPAEVPSLIDELPILSLAAAAAQGTSHFQGLAELRVKESDRLAAIVRLLDLLGVETQSGADWLTITGKGSAADFAATAQSYAPGLDHRMAMTAAIANLVSPSELKVAGFAEAVGSSWPNFETDMAQLVYPDAAG